MQFSAKITKKISHWFKSEKQLVPKYIIYLTNVYFRLRFLHSASRYQKKISVLHIRNGTRFAFFHHRLITFHTETNQEKVSHLKS